MDENLLLYCLIGTGETVRAVTADRAGAQVRDDFTCFPSVAERSLRMNAEILALVPFILFAAVMTGTPGPNNAMVTVSAARIGARRTMPLVLGITMGTALMFVAMAFGLHALLARLPVLDGVLRVLAAGVLVWIAWKILNAGPLDASDERPLLGYVGGAAFQWVNPKAWAITGSAATIYLPVPAGALDIGVHALLLCAVGTCLVSLWALLGAALRGPLSRPSFARVFNTSMALLLVVSTLPVLLGTHAG